MVADSEADFTQRVALPYGRWTCSDGRQVLFNRFYEALWQRWGGGLAVPADPTEWVTWERQEWFYDDGTPQEQVQQKAAEVLAEWGLPMPDWESIAGDYQRPYIHPERTVYRPRPLQAARMAADTLPARVAAIMAANPELSDHGFGVFEGHRLSPQERAERLAQDRQDLLSPDGLNGIQRASEWLLKQKRRLAINRRIGSSYLLKHFAEDDVGYVTNGQFIAAAMLIGMKVQRCPRGSPNAFLNISSRLRTMTADSTISVQISVGPLEAVSGRGPLRYLTFIELDFAGVAIIIQGVCVTADRFGKLTVQLPQSKSQGSGYWAPAIVLPLQLHRAVEQAILGSIPGVGAIYVTAPVDG